MVVLSPTWWIPPLRWRCGRNDIRFWFDCYRFKRTTIPAYAGWRQIAAATLRGSIQPHGLYSKCSGRLVADELMCDCHRQSIDFYSLRGAPPLHAQYRFVYCLCNISRSPPAWILLCLIPADIPQKASYPAPNGGKIPEPPGLPRHGWRGPPGLPLCGPSRG